ncbi:hypothetical protein [Actinomadura coerulea]|uniref:hypothetical protein n=1 Tax=Actinomadura coerulea TaxID=46159 RepID=UPI00342FECA7
MSLRSVAPFTKTHGDSGIRGAHGRHNRSKTARTILTLVCGAAVASAGLTGVASATATPTAKTERTAPGTPGRSTAQSPATLRAVYCTDITYRGSAGSIFARTSPNGTVAWGIYMHDISKNDGPWIVDVYVGSRRVDHKEQTYAPHGSVPPSQATKGATFTIRATHTDLQGHIYHEVPNGCIIP